MSLQPLRSWDVKVLVNDRNISMDSEWLKSPIIPGESIKVFFKRDDYGQSIVFRNFRSDSDISKTSSLHNPKQLQRDIIEIAMWAMWMTYLSETEVSIFQYSCYLFIPTTVGRGLRDATPDHFGRSFQCRFIFPTLSDFGSSPFADLVHRPILLRQRSS